ncbi:nucleotidyltransferase family protein [Leptolyngbyaceae cyanobacterium UHCC 1019]
MKQEKGLEIAEVLGKKREEILAIAAHHGASNVRIFGSVARGEARPDSDVDFLVNLEKGRNLLDRISLIQDLEDLLNRKVDVAEPENLHRYIRDKVLREAIVSHRVIACT